MTILERDLKLIKEFVVDFDSFFVNGNDMRAEFINISDTFFYKNSILMLLGL